MRELFTIETPARNFKSYAEEMLECFKDNEKYRNFCITIHEIKDSKDIFTIGRALGKHFDCLPEDIKDLYNNTSYFQLYRRTKALVER